VRPRDLIGDREKIEELPYLHAVIDAEVVRHESDYAANRHWFRGDRKTGDPSLACRGSQERRQKPNRRTLARAVGSDKAEDLTLADGKAEVVYGDKISIALGEVDHLDH